MPASTVKISTATRRVMEALADTIIPSDGPALPGARDLEVVSHLLEWLSEIRLAVPGFVAVCWAWEFSPLAAGRLARFSRLSEKDRECVLDRFEQGGFVRRWALLLFKAVFMASFYRQPAAWAMIGYQDGCLSALPGGREVAP